MLFCYFPPSYVKNTPLALDINLGAELTDKDVNPLDTGLISVVNKTITTTNNISTCSISTLQLNKQSSITTEVAVSLKTLYGVSASCVVFL